MAEINISVGENAPVRSEFPDTNFEGYSMAHGRVGAYYHRSLMKFVLSGIPSGQIINNAILYGTQINCFGSPTTDIFTFSRITDAWDASTVVWNDNTATSSTNRVETLINFSNAYKPIANVTGIVTDAYNASLTNVEILGRLKTESVSYGRRTFTTGMVLYVLYGITGDFYVKTTGDDTKDGDTWANAWATINKAATTVPDGFTVHIGVGNYNAEPAGNKIAPQNVGASGIAYTIVNASTGLPDTGSVVVEKN